MKDLAVLKSERIAKEFLQKRVKNCYQINGKGTVNQVCVAETDNNKVVIRMNDLGAYLSFIKEKWCIEQARVIGIVLKCYL
ncbi:hypothetical protein [Metabacillus malikii]|uniref:Uncharacterized protein n=1 Tax=Metabacillus malikii TaxID=1504265 RepID=A0ABT9ZN86_9BACI|nr:hypothetical protein [Metabacillus malikii]MDQ0233256.1 hypothetical protein [Metabacillus malikii]